MELIPAIDILNGQVVRLHQGRYDAVTVYGDDPAAVARGFEQAGARRLHVVDLDGAKNAEPANIETIAAILEATELKVQVGGGIRTEATAARWFDAGASGVVLGTVALKEPELGEAIAKRWPGQTIIAIDARDGKVAVEGWLEQSERPATDLARQVDTWGLDAILYTNIGRDGTRDGPDVEGTAALQATVQSDVIASGGIGTLAHVEALARAGVRLAVCGRALYAGAFDLGEANQLLEELRC